MCNQKNKIKEQTKQKQIHRDQTDGCQRRGELGDWVKR